MEPNGVQWWLAELDQHGNPRLCDGAHGDRAGAERALYLYQHLGLDRGERYAICRVELFDAVAVAHDANLDAINTLVAAGLGAKS